MGVTPDHLVGDGARYRIEIEVAGLARHLGVVDDLKQQVAQLVLQGRHVALLDRVGDLVGLLDRMGRYRMEGLLQIPWAAAIGIAKPGHDLKETVNVSGHVG